MANLIKWKMDTLERILNLRCVSMTSGLINILFVEFPFFVCQGVAFDLCKETPPPTHQKKTNVIMGRHATAVQELGRASDYPLPPPFISIFQS